MMFCTEHILLMYFKKTLHQDSNLKKKQFDHDSNQNSDDGESFENDFSKDDFSDIENETHFWSILSMILNCLIQSKKKDFDASMI